MCIRDRSHNIENSIEGIIYSVMNIQTAFAKSLIIDRKALSDSQSNNDTVLSNKLVMEAFETDVQPLIESCLLYTSRNKYCVPASFSSE